MTTVESTSMFSLRACLGIGLGFVVGTIAWNALPYDPLLNLQRIAPPSEILAGIDALPTKTENELRILIVGASLTSGFPYQPAGAVSYARLLEQGLTAALPNRPVVARAFASPALDCSQITVLAERALAHEPDVLVVTLGANELGSRILGGEAIAPSDWQEWIADRSTRSRLLFVASLGNSSQVSGEQAEGAMAGLLARILQAAPGKPIVTGLPVSTQDRALFAEGVRASMRRITELANERGVRLLFCCAPYDLAGSWPRGMTAHIPEIDALVAAERSVPGSVDLTQIDALLTNWPKRADLHLLRGRSLERAGRAGEAKQAYRSARDLDPAPLHLIGSIEAAIIEEAQALGVTSLLLNEALSSSGQFLDPTHLTAAGHLQVASYLAAALAADLPDGWRVPFAEAGETYLNDRLTPQDRRQARASMDRATAVLHMLFGNLRDALPPLSRSMPGLRDLTAGPMDPDYLDWTRRWVLCVYAGSGHRAEITAMSATERATFFQSIAARLWQAEDPAQVKALAIELVAN